MWSGTLSRTLVAGLLIVAVGAWLCGCGSQSTAMRTLSADQPNAAGEAIAVMPPEDLMREHGLLRRLLLVYQEALRRDAAGEAMPLPQVRQAAEIVRTFIEGYHEKLEEDYLFPRFQKAGVQVELTRTLLEQHQAGRALTAAILRLSAPQATQDAMARAELAQDLLAFIRMYYPHAAREDTVLFPLLRTVVTPKEFSQLGDAFEDKEHELFGEHGFENYVDKVAGIEKNLGIYRLSQFTPKIHT